MYWAFQVARAPSRARWALPSAIAGSGGPSLLWACAGAAAPASTSRMMGSARSRIPRILASCRAMLNVPTFRRLAVIEATSFLLLLAATVVKYSADRPIGVSILGPIHGLLFLAYVYLALQLRVSEDWDGRTT